MGQCTVGILYGCESPDLPAGDPYDDSPAYELVKRWEEARRITRSTKGPKIRVESEGGRELIGVWVAVGGSGKDDAPYFLENSLLLADVSIVFAKRTAEAQKLWWQFADHVASKEKVTLPAPALWLTPTETA